MKKSIMYLVMLILFTSTINAESINLNEQENPIITQINSYDIVSEIAKEYNSMSIKVEDYQVVLIFEQNKLKEIQEYNNQTTDLDIELSRQQIDYLLNNYKTMNKFEKFMFLLRTNMPVSDILTFSGLAMGVRA